MSIDRLEAEPLLPAAPTDDVFGELKREISALEIRRWSPEREAAHRESHLAYVALKAREFARALLDLEMASINGNETLARVARRSGEHVASFLVVLGLANHGRLNFNVAAAKYLDTANAERRYAFVRKGFDVLWDAVQTARHRRRLSSDVGELLTEALDDADELVQGKLPPPRNRRRTG